MELLDELTVHFGTDKKRIELLHGDLTEIPEEHAVDILVISAIPNNYWPNPVSLIGSLHKKGLLVSSLAENKAADLRENFSCWLSHEIDPLHSNLKFRRILCFEPSYNRSGVRPSEVVGDIFRSLMPFVFDTPPIKKIAMPIVATGVQRVPVNEVLEPLLHAAVNWLELGMPVTHIKIVEYDKQKANELKEAFRLLKRKYSHSTVRSDKDEQEFQYDYFISYSHDDIDAAMFMFNAISTTQPKTSIFVDQKILDLGVAWQNEIFEAIDASRKVITIYSPSYLNSKVCKEEFNIALFRHRDTDLGVLLPIYWQSAGLPTYMKLIQYADCRENDLAKLKTVCHELLKPG